MIVDIYLKNRPMTKDDNKTTDAKPSKDDVSVSKSSSNAAKMLGVNINLGQGQKVRLNVFGPPVSNPLLDSWAKGTDGHSGYSSASGMYDGAKAWQEEMERRDSAPRVTIIPPKANSPEQQAPSEPVMANPQHAVKAEEQISITAPQIQKKPTMYIDEEALKNLKSVYAPEKTDGLTKDIKNTVNNLMGYFLQKQDTNKNLEKNSEKGEDKNLSQGHNQSTSRGSRGGGSSRSF